VFFHNALDIITLAALTAEMAQIVGAARDGSLPPSPGPDLFSLSRMFESAGETGLSVSACARAIEAGLPGPVELQALRCLASQYKRSRQFESAEELWMKLTRHEAHVALEAYRELAIHYEHRRRDAAKALLFTEQALSLLTADLPPAGNTLDGLIEQFTRRRQRLLRRLSTEPKPANTQIATPAHVSSDLR
jgi:tetratricopeptide (TPR) repeat protein